VAIVTRTLRGGRRNVRTAGGAIIGDPIGEE
jgi:hypothetical protein